MRPGLRFATLALLAVGCSLEPGAGENYESTESALTVQSSSCRIDYTVSSDWGSGFGADVKVTNLGNSISTWTVEWTYPNGQRVTSLWNGSYTQTGNVVKVKDAGWNGSLAKGASASFGFNGAASGTNGNPTGFKLNGVSCEGGTVGTGGSSGSGGSTSTGGSTSSGGTTSSGGSSSGGSGGSANSCNYPAWQQGAWYPTGSIVKFEGAYYIAEHENPGYSPTISTWFWDPYTCTGGSGGSGGGTGSGGSGGGTSGTGFAAHVSKAQFEAIFPNRNGFYTYEGLVEAAKIYPTFANEGSATLQKQEAAAFLANVAHETGNLIYIEEIARGDYTDYSPWFCPPAPGKKYYGRGPIQLSWNYNYCAASQSIFGDREVLRLDPDRVAREAKIAWATAIWFWMTQTGAGSMTSHNGIVQGRGFGETIRTINGGLECNGANPGAVNARIGYYQNISSRLGVGTQAPLGC